MATNFEEQLTKGRKIENLINSILQNSGWYTISIFNHKYDPANNKEIAPSLNTKDRKIKLPDIQAYKNGKGIWVECKYEQGANWTYSTQIFEHGMSNLLFQHYKMVSEITNMPVWIIFYEANQQQRTQIDYDNCLKKQKPLPPCNNYPTMILRGKKITDLKNLRYSDRGSNYSNNTYVYFPQSDLIEFGSIRNPNFDLLEF